MAAKRHLGQHFLSDPSILGRIADALEPAPGDPVVEIGPGRGALTRVLLARGVRLVAIERDRDLIATLEEQFPGLSVVEGDALELDWPRLLHLAPGERWLAVGNIPYNINSPLLAKALEPPRPARIVFLVQREVALRLAARPGTADYGALTVGVTVVAAVERLFTVPAGAFRPRPRVESAVVRLTPRAEPLVSDQAFPAFRRLVTALFGARRKQLVRALRTVLDLTPDQADRAVAAAGLEPRQRPETLSLEDFVRLSRGLVDEGMAGALGL